MPPETKQEGTGTPQVTTGAEDTKAETITLTRAEYDELHSSLGSLKRELKDYKKSQKETKEETTPQLDSGLVEKTYLRAAGITHEEDVKLALETAKKWGMPIDKIVDDEDFIAKLEKTRTQRSNLEATTNVRGDKSGGNAKDTTAYWMAKGTPPTPNDVSDPATRRKIVREMMVSSKSKPKFYNE